MLFLITLAIVIDVSAAGLSHPLPPPLEIPNPQDCSVLGPGWIKPEGDYAFHTPLCFLFVNKLRTCHKAGRYCAAKGARLVEIYTWEKDAWIWSKISNSTEPRWIGLKFNGSKDFPLWMSGAAALPSPPYFNNWCDGQPDDDQSPEDCVVVQNMSGMWNDIPSGEKKMFICETLVFD
ncbi:hypothetical protein ScPMuIL_002495 [Solemya velum]